VLVSRLSNGCVFALVHLLNDVAFLRISLLSDLMYALECHFEPLNVTRAAILAAALFLAVQLAFVVTSAVGFRARAPQAVVSTALLLQTHVPPVGGLRAVVTLEISHHPLFLADDLVSDTSDTCCTGRLSFRTRYHPNSDIVPNTEDHQDFEGICIGRFHDRHSRMCRLCQRTSLLPRTAPGYGLIRREGVYPIQQHLIKANCLRTLAKAQFVAMLII